MARRPGQPAADYGTSADGNRPAVQALTVEQIREKLATNPLAAKRLRSVLDSGCTESDPLVGITTLGILTWRGRWTIEVVHTYARPDDRWARGRACKPWGGS